METSLNKLEKVTQKHSEIILTCYHEINPKWIGVVAIGPDKYWTEPNADKDEIESDLRILEKRLTYELIETKEMEGVYPERATIIEEKYQASGRDNGLYTGLNLINGTIPDSTSN
jgi:hypothetical protein